MDKIHVRYNYKLEHVLINDRYGEYNLKSMSEFIPSWRTAERFQWYLFWYACVRVWPSFLLLSHCDGVILGDDIIDNLRFPVMEENEFNVVKSTNLLTKEETQEVLNNFADSRWPIRFLRHKRQYDPSSQRRTLYHRGQILDIFD